MKIIFFLVTLLFNLSTFAASSFTSIQPTYSGWCALKSDELICSHIIASHIPGVTFFSSYRGGLCANAAGSVFCVGESDVGPRNYTNTFFSDLINPRESAQNQKIVCFLDDSDLQSSFEFTGITCYRHGNDPYYGSPVGTVYKIRNGIQAPKLRFSHLALGSYNGYAIRGNKLLSFSPRDGFSTVKVELKDITGYDQKIYASGFFVCLKGTAGTKCFHNGEPLTGHELKLRAYEELTKLVEDAKEFVLSGENYSTQICTISKSNKVGCWNLRYEYRKTILTKFELPSDFEANLKNPRAISINQAGALVGLHICVISDVGLQCLKQNEFKKDFSYYEVL